jgi:cell division septation protein DedD
VQVGTFASSSNATALAATLESRGYAAFVAPIASGGRTLYRVRVGPTADIESARALEQRLEKEGRKVDVVRQP